ncbi:MAG: EAL domain-containing protein [Leptolyngbyaceae cyanobacterium bins.59]|nr:EAL domain-containing protein [Leptolyngbyaceae cyanobacterium bins.59]
MEKQLFSCQQAFPEDWENTPETVKRWVESFLLTTNLLDYEPSLNPSLKNEQLSEHESRLIQFLDATPIGIAVHDATGQIIYINQVGRSLLCIQQNTPPDCHQIPQFFQVYREGTQDLYPVEDLPSTRALTGEVVWADDLEIHRSDRILPLEVCATPIFDEQGQVRYAIAAFQDIGERKHLAAEQKRRELERQIVENTLLRSERRYLQVIQTQTDWILRSLPDTTITFANEALCAALGSLPEEVMGMQWSCFVPPEEVEGLHRKIAALTPENPIFESINSDERSDHQGGWTQWVNLGIFDDRGQLVEIQSVGRDITALQEQILREQALNRVFQAIRNSLDLSTIFATATAEAAQLLKGLDCFVVQYLSEERIWRHVAEFRHRPDAPTIIGLEIPDTGNPFAEQLKRLQSVQVEDTFSLNDGINQEVAQTLPGAWLLIPLVIEGTLWGSFTITTTQHPFRWQEDQIALAQSVADQLEVAIQQANLYQQVQLELEERRRAEAAFQESESRFQKMADNVPGIIYGYRLQPDGSDQFTYISSGFRDVYGFEPDGVLQDSSIIWNLTHPDDVEQLQASVIASYQTMQTWQCQYRVITPAGQLKWMQGIARPTRQPNGDVIWDGLIIDISDRKQAEVALEESEQRFRQLFESTPKIAVQGYNSQRQVIYWNDASEHLYGYTKLEALGRQLEDLIIPPEMREGVITGIQEWLVEAQPIPAGELSLMRKDGSRVVVYSSHLMLTNANGEQELYCVDIDLSDRKQAEEAMRESEMRYRLLAENMNDLVCLHDIEGRYLYVSPSSEALLGYRYNEILGQDPYTFFHPDDRDRVYEEAHIVAMNGKPSPITYRIRHKSGDYIWFETLTKPITNSTGQIIQLQTTSRDVTERIQVQNQLQYDALHDALTGLPNRQLLIERLELAIRRTQRFENYHFAVLFLDLDRFKVINDSLGHLVGDQLLIAITQKLQETLRSIDLVARLGGDEFVILLEDIRDIQEAVRATERIFTTFKTPLIIEGREVYTTASIGIVLGTQNYTQASHLLRDADIAMYRAKNRGKSRYEIFDAVMHTQALHRLHLENDLRRAIEHQEFVLHYQPIVALDTGRLIGLEALIRWQHPTQGLKSPGDFIAIAEETGLITALDCWALQQACEQVAVWHNNFPDFATLKVSVNLSAQDLRRLNLLEEIDRILTQTQISGDCLALEITESMLIEDIEATIHLLNQLKARGIQISIDDFGTGYSSLSYLHRLPVDNLKVDRSFVHEIQTGKRNHQIVETIVALSNQLELDTIAEGIETPEQLDRLRDLGYKFGQGYLFSQPLTPEAVEAWLREQADPTRLLFEGQCPVN